MAAFQAKGWQEAYKNYQEIPKGSNDMITTHQDSLPAKVTKACSPPSFKKTIKCSTNMYKLSSMNNK